MISGLFTQIIMFILAGAIVFTYVQPTFQSIGQIQDDIAVYKEEQEKVQVVNERLDQLVERQSLVSSTEQAELFTYVPDEVDPIIIQRDLVQIAGLSGAIFEDVSYESGGSSQRSGGGGSDATASVSGVAAHSFSLAVSGTYEQTLELLSLLERNKYPLEVTALELSPVEGGFVSASLTLTTYQLADEEAASDSAE
ncbi:MAG: hypothetical protein ACOC4E_00370 [Patescibacteria group bacterium]